MRSNKSRGNQFERELVNTLYDNGFWVHLFQQNASGQPADILAIKDGRAYLIDAKDCKNDVFKIDRVEPNQEMSMRYFRAKSFTDGLFALNTSSGIYMLGLLTLLELRQTKSSLNFGEIIEYGVPLEIWASC